MPVVPVLTMFTNLLMLVSAAETGTVVASISLAAIGKGDYCIKTIAVLHEILCQYCSRGVDMNFL